MPELKHANKIGICFFDLFCFPTGGRQGRFVTASRFAFVSDHTIPVMEHHRQMFRPAPWIIGPVLKPDKIVLVSV